MIIPTIIICIVVLSIAIKFDKMYKHQDLCNHEMNVSYTGHDTTCRKCGKTNNLY